MINKDFLDFSGLNIFFNKIKTLFALKSEIPTNYIISGSQTTTSSTDGGSNIYTFTNSDGTLSTITVKNGSKGSSGTSITISSTSVMYQSSSSGTTTPTGAWSESIPSTSAGQYLWTKTVVTYSDGNSTTSYSVSRNGSNGSNATTTAVATQTQNGLESAADKKKLDGIATGAEVNQNAFSNIVVNTTTVSADSKTDTLTLVAGDNIDIIPDATNDKITISCTYDNPTFNVGSDGHLYMQH